MAVLSRASCDVDGVGPRVYYCKTTTCNASILDRTSVGLPVLAVPRSAAITSQLENRKQLWRLATARPSHRCHRPEGFLLLSHCCPAHGSGSTTYVNSDEARKSKGVCSLMQQKRCEKEECNGKK
ncbi:hypothetical protein B296_00028095 [Ensete ventricosum]|uniref:Uncharacterized protein n=1 Tax=Ensete ventricosum TaxID=4639 RepID=A0A427A974_ENSVE|nr:hypothetical protein B296_00028095 [Ensete ventricosum]